MKFQSSILLPAITTLCVLVSGAVHAAKPASSVICSDSTSTTGNAGYVECQGSITGNIAPGQVNTATFAGYDTFDLVGTSDDASAGPFSVDVSGYASGTLSFDTVQKGYFVLGIKGGPTFSLYLFNGGTDGISTLSFDTLGISKGNGSAGPGLSHFALFTAPAGPVASIPEPNVGAMILAGLGVVGFVVSRNRRV